MQIGRDRSVRVRIKFRRIATLLDEGKLDGPSLDQSKVTSRTMKAEHETLAARGTFLPQTVFTCSNSHRKGRVHPHARRRRSIRPQDRSSKGPGNVKIGGREKT